mgnify:CR=1 FL=1
MRLSFEKRLLIRMLDSGQKRSSRIFLILELELDKIDYFISQNDRGLIKLALHVWPKCFFDFEFDLDKIGATFVTKVDRIDSRID